MLIPTWSWAKTEILLFLSKYNEKFKISSDQWGHVVLAKETVSKKNRRKLVELSAARNKRLTGQAFKYYVMEQILDFCLNCNAECPTTKEITIDIIVKGMVKKQRSYIRDVILRTNYSAPCSSDNIQDVARHNEIIKAMQGKGYKISVEFPSHDDIDGNPVHDIMSLTKTYGYRTKTVLIKEFVKTEASTTNNSCSTKDVKAKAKDVNKTTTDDNMNASTTNNNCSTKDVKAKVKDVNKTTTDDNMNASTTNNNCSTKDVKAKAKDVNKTTTDDNINASTTNNNCSTKDVKAKVKDLNKTTTDDNINASTTNNNCSTKDVKAKVKDLNKTTTDDNINNIIVSLKEINIGRKELSKRRKPMPLSSDAVDTAHKRTKYDYVKHINIEPKDYPHTKITKNMAAEIQKSIQQTIDYTQVLPLLKCHGIQDGVLSYSCHNKESLEIIKNVVKPFNLYVTLTEEKEKGSLRMSLKLNTFIDESVKSSLNNLETFNLGLSTKDWVFIRKEQYSDFIVIFVDMDLDSYNFIRSRHFKLYVGIDEARFSVVWD